MVGITGVIWYPRGAAPNSTALIAGAGPVPLSVASGSWSAMSAGLADTASTVNRVMTNLRTGWSGDAADQALAKLGPFEEWAAKSAVLAEKTGGKAQVQSTSYTFAAIAMPSLPEISAVTAAKLAAYSLGGAITGAASVMEIAEEQLKIRAAIAMETYDSATAQLTVREEFDVPPSITMSEAKKQGAAQVSGIETSSIGGFVEPVRAAAAAISSVISHPAFAAIASQVGATQAAAAAATTAVTSAGAAAAGAAGAAGAATAITGAGAGLGTSATSLLSTPLSALGALAGGATGRHAAATSAAAASPVGTGASSSGFSANSVRAEGSASQVTPRAASGLAMNPASVEPSRADAARADVVRSTTGSGTSGMGGGRHAAADDDDTATHDTPDYLKHFEHFTDGRTVITSVIGGTDLETQP